jgi:NAD+ synthase
LTAISRRSAPPARVCRLVVFSELVTIGYPPEDPVRPAVIDATRRAVEALVADTAAGPAMLVTAPWAEAVRSGAAAAGRRPDCRYSE